MEERVLNAERLTPNATLLGLGVMRQRRQSQGRGRKVVQLVARWDSPLGRGIIRPMERWAEYLPGIPKEKKQDKKKRFRALLVVLVRIRIPGGDQEDHIKLWQTIFGEVREIVRLINHTPPEEIERSKAVAREYGFEVDKRNSSGPLSKQAARLRGLAKQLRRIAARKELECPVEAARLEEAARNLEQEATAVAALYQGKKRHPRHPETSRLLDLMARTILPVTGRQYDRELAMLLRLAGAPRYWTAGRFRETRSKERRKKRERSKTRRR